MLKELKIAFEKCHGISLEKYGEHLRERKPGKRVCGSNSRVSVVDPKKSKTIEEIEKESGRILSKW